MPDKVGLQVEKNSVRLVISKAGSIMNCSRTKERKKREEVFYTSE